MRTNGFKQITLLALALVALGLQSWAINDRPDFRGKIAQIHINIDQAKSLGTVLIKVNGKARPQDKLILIITKETHIYQQSGEGRHEIKYQELQFGDLIEAHVTGHVMESLPGQVVAAEIVALKRSGDVSLAK